MKNIFFYIVLFLLVTGCSTVKHVPDNHYLLDKVEVHSSARNIPKEKFKPYIKQNQNVRILGMFKFHLWLYNLAGKDSTKGINKWLKRIGEEPVLFDDFLSAQTASQLKLFMYNKGYYHSDVDTIIKKKRKKAKVEYKINSGRQFEINEIGFRAEDAVIDSLIQEEVGNSLLKKGKPFDVSIHDAERERIMRILKDKGYYGFSKEFVYFKVDTTVGNYMVNDSVLIKSIRKQNAGGKDFLYEHPLYKINDVFFRMNFDSHRALNEKEDYYSRFDTLVYGDFNFLYIDNLKVKPEVLVNSTFISPGQLYQADRVDKTKALLSGLKLYRFINIRFEELTEEDEEDGNKLLNCYIQLMPAKFQSYSIDIEGLNSSGNLGAGGNLEYKHKNLFKGAEEFTFNIGGSMQKQLTRQKEQFNTTEFGVETSIVFPKFWMPFKIKRFRQRFNPKTSLSAAYNYQHRPDYTRTIANGKISYLWNSSKRVSHQVTPIGVNFVLIPTIDSDFLDDIEGNYLWYSYQDHLVTNTTYSIVYNQQEVDKRKDFWYVNWNLEEAGNFLNMWSSVFSEKPAEDYYTVLGIRYAQYVQSDIDIRYHHYLNKINSLAYRFHLGVGYPYGNYKVLPFEKRYFAGGANSLRAWPVRGVGPGSYSADDADYFNQTGDIKLEVNAEYRFKLFWILEGALFLDVGNIYTIRSDISPEGGLFRFNDFTEKLAVGTGMGMRFDFKYFIFRLDTGMKLRDPVEIKGERWIPGSRKYVWDDFAFNFAIGYPF
ncbi:BamA/TamA family outer membrane protein [Plebeiibacterium marinum]|uniref:BamA/TamA family outer membrane protein n=1 Tax=Plebeiibacterium marinum TaxID=2992111 RepID=A0AAE3MAK6_9BACT|nr:BamA/TamA family outer membrane protein [Plebeiobacterium marinum]MCW3804109.1 BamA/TamA family outer membrane protein [Plebeiobacterium marinum]